MNTNTFGASERHPAMKFWDAAKAIPKDHSDARSEAMDFAEDKLTESIQELSSRELAELLRDTEVSTADLTIRMQREATARLLINML